MRETGAWSFALLNAAKCDGDCLVPLARDAEASGEFRVFLKPKKRIELIRWLRKPAGKIAPKYTWWNSAVPRERDLKEELRARARDHQPVVDRALERALENGNFTILAFFKQNEKGLLEPTVPMEWILDWDTWKDMRERRDFIEQIILVRESCDLHPALLRGEGQCTDGLKDGHWRFSIAVSGEKSESIEEGLYAKGRRIGKWREGLDWYIYEDGMRRKIPSSKRAR